MAQGSRLTAVEIKRRILAALRNFPMTVYEISVDQKISYSAVQRQIKVLESLNKVRMFKQDGRTLWRLRTRPPGRPREHAKKKKDSKEMSAM